MEHFSWMQLIPGVGHEYVHVATAMAVTALIVIFSLAGRLALGSGEAAIMPAQGFSVKGVFEVVIEFINSLVIMVLGEEGRHYIPLFGSVFCYIFFSNVFGLLPGFSASTSNMNTAVA